MPEEVDSAEGLEGEYVEPFNSLEETIWTLPDWIKKPHKANYLRDDLKKEKVPPEEIAGAVIRTIKGTVLFSYGSRNKLNQNIPYWVEKSTAVLQVYLGVSFDSFQKAENLYKRTENLDSIERFLSG